MFVCHLLFYLFSYKQRQITSKKTIIKTNNIEANGYLCSMGISMGNLHYKIKALVMSPIINKVKKKIRKTKLIIIIMLSG